MKRAGTGLIALSMLLFLSLPASATPVSKNPYHKKQARAKEIKQRPNPPSPAKPTLAKKQDGDPTQSWQSYSYP